MGVRSCTLPDAQSKNLGLTSRFGVGLCTLKVQQRVSHSGPTCTC